MHQITVAPIDWKREKEFDSDQLNYKGECEAYCIIKGEMIEAKGLHYTDAAANLVFTLNTRKESKQERK